VPRTLKTLLCSLVLCGAAAAAASAAASGPEAAAAGACKPPSYPGSGYFTSLSVSRTSCSTGRSVARAHHACRVKHGLRGRCTRSVLRYSCSEHRVSIPSEIDSRVTCKRGTRRVVFYYQQNL
jgi:hypothetical protein